MEIGLMSHDSGLDGVQDGIELLRDEDAERAMGHIVDEGTHLPFGDVSEEPHAAMAAGRLSLGPGGSDSAHVMSVLGSHHPHDHALPDSLLVDPPPTKRRRISKGVSDTSSLYLHDLGEAPETAFKKVLACSFCPRSFSTTGQLTRHMRTHGGKSFPCPTCHASFSTRCALSTHSKTVHEGKKEFLCKQCDRAFGLKGNLVRHVKEVHEKKKDFPCTLCSRAFGQKGDLLRHVKTLHQGVRNFKCPHCIKAFGHKGDLNRHISTVHQSRKAFHCDQCQTSFGEKGHLNRHKRTVHQSKKEPPPLAYVDGVQLGVPGSQPAPSTVPPTLDADTQPPSTDSNNLINMMAAVGGGANGGSATGNHDDGVHAVDLMGTTGDSFASHDPYGDLSEHRYDDALMDNGGFSSSAHVLGGGHDMIAGPSTTATDPSPAKETAGGANSTSATDPTEIPIPLPPLSLPGLMHDDPLDDHHTG